MKSILKIQLIAVLFVFVFSSCAIFQKGDGFQGTVTYGVTYESDELSASERAQLPSEIVVYISGNKIRTDRSTAFFSMSSIDDYDENKTTLLIDYMGQKIAIIQTDEEMKENMEDVEYPEIRFVEEARMIEGYRSKKAEVISNGDIFEVFYTNELDVPDRINEMTMFKQIKGLLMDYTMEENGVRMRVAVKEIDSGRVPAHKFRIPDDYEVKSPEELGGLFGGM